MSDLIDVNALQQPTMIGQYAASAIQMPTFFDIEGKQHKSYSYAYGPHSGKICDCLECTKFNQDFENREEAMKLLEKVHKDAFDTFSSYFMRNCYGGPSASGSVDINTALQVMINFTKKQIAEYQQEMMKRVQSIQLEHTARLARVMNQQNKMAEVRARRDAERRVKGEHDGRLFRVDEKEDTD